MDRAFTMPQFVTSVAGYGGSARAKQVGQVLERTRMRIGLLRITRGDGPHRCCWVSAPLRRRNKERRRKWFCCTHKDDYVCRLHFCSLAMPVNYRRYNEPN